MRRPPGFGSATAGGRFGCRCASGAPVSLRVMETVLNVGLNRETLQGLCSCPV